MLVRPHVHAHQVAAQSIQLEALVQERQQAEAKLHKRRVHDQVCVQKNTN